jgi:CRP/FNR family transcriptional regulator
MLNLGFGQVYTEGDIIFSEGDPGNALYVIQFGHVKIVKHTGGQEVCLATLGPGEIFGEMSMFDQRERSATAIALGEARVLTVDRQKFFATMSRDPTLTFKILSSMSQRLRQMDNYVSQQPRA